MVLTSLLFVLAKLILVSPFLSIWTVNSSDTTTGSSFPTDLRYAVKVRVTSSMMLRFKPLAQMYLSDVPYLSDKNM